MPPAVVDHGSVSPSLANFDAGGRGFGGSSVINGLFYGRGSASVYDKWAQLGNPGWGWDDVYPLFVKVIAPLYYRGLD